MEATYYPSNLMVQRLLKMMETNPLREFPSREVSLILDCELRAVGALLANSLSAGLLHRHKVGRTLVYRRQPYADSEGFRRPAKLTTPKPLPKAKPAASWQPDPDDVRITRVVPGWKPPVMRHVRGGA